MRRRQRILELFKNMELKVNKAENKIKYEEVKLSQFVILKAEKFIQMAVQDEVNES